ncbi:MAG: hypothetical protein ABJF01_03485 [bacterium]
MTESTTKPEDTRGEAPSNPPSRLPWEAPKLSKLPSLTELTLQTGSAIPGGGGGSSTVF